MILPSTIKKIEIEEKVIQLYDYEEKIKAELEITNVEYPKIYEDAKDNFNFHDPYVNARVIPNTNFNGVKEMIICTGTLAEKINQIFGKIIDRETFENAAEIYIKCTLVHEMVHVKQITEKTLTKDIYDRNKDLDPSKIEYEIEARNMSKHIVGREGIFANEIITIILENIVIDYDIANNLTEKFKL